LERWSFLRWSSRPVLTNMGRTLSQVHAVARAIIKLLTTGELVEMLTFGVVNGTHKNHSKTANKIKTCQQISKV